jgi:hypothetical protein
MRSKFFEFAFCENDWKADYLATESYPSWYSNHIKANKIKEEVIDSYLPTGSKRLLSAEVSETDIPKRVKVRLQSATLRRFWFPDTPQLRNPLLERKKLHTESSSLSTDSSPLSSRIILTDPSASVAVTPEIAETVMPATSSVDTPAIPSLVVTQVDADSIDSFEDSSGRPRVPDVEENYRSAQNKQGKTYLPL